VANSSGHECSKTSRGASCWSPPERRSRRPGRYLVSAAPEILGQVEAEIREHTARLNLLRGGPTAREVQLAESLQTAPTRQQEREREFADLLRPEMTGNAKILSGKRYFASGGKSFKNKYAAATS
jgi:hypothetical protein